MTPNERPSDGLPSRSITNASGGSLPKSLEVGRTARDEALDLLAFEPLHPLVEVRRVEVDDDDPAQSASRCSARGSRRAEPGFARREPNACWLALGCEGGGQRGNHGFSRYWPSRAMTFLELLAAPAPAGIVAADLLFVGDDTLLLRGDGGRAAAHRAGEHAAASIRGHHARPRAGRGDRFRSRQRLVLVGEGAAVDVLHALELLGIGRSHLGVEEHQQDLLVDQPAELLEHHVALAPVLDERILLRERAKMDALAQVVHVLEVLAPAGVDHHEDDVALDLARDLRAPELLLLGVSLVRLLAEVVDERLAGDLAEVLLELLDGEVRARQRVEGLHKPVEIPVVGVVALRVLGDKPFDHVVDPAAHLLGEVLALEHLAPLGIDHLTLHVQDVVVLEDILPRDKVLLLDLLLRVLDLLREKPGLHGLVVGHLEALHDPEDPVAGEEADEVVLTREVEPRLAGIALAPRAAPELVVDAPRFVALGAEHVEAAEVDDALVELDVDAAAGHVRRDRDRSPLACVLDDLRLALVLLRVQDVVRDPLSREELREVL